MKWGRLTVILVCIIALVGLMAWSSQDIARGINLGLDLKGGFEVLYEAQPVTDGAVEITPALLEQTVASLERRISVLGTAEPYIAIEGQNRIRVQLAGVEDQDAARELLGKPARLTLRDVQTGEVLISGADLREGGASVGFDQLNRAIVQVSLKDASRFYDLTRQYVGQPIGIFLDEILISAPVVQEPIPGGIATITGQESLEEARELADLLNAGALPLNLVEVQAISVGASLGMLFLSNSLMAGLLGAVFIFLFMLLFYRLPGLVSCVTLSLYVYLVLLVFQLMQVTLTLPGIAAVILGVGMAVDANIITAERIKEEIRSGKTIPSALRAGSRRSFITILDANVTTIIAATALFSFGNSAIRGFSIALIVSIVLSMLTNVFLSRILLQQVIRSNVGRKPWYFGVREDQISEL